MTTEITMPPATTAEAKDGGGVVLQRLVRAPRPYYQDAAVTLYHGNAYELLPTLEKPNLLLTDPPYEMAMGGGGIGGKREYTHAIKREALHEGFDVSLLDGYENWICFCSKAQLPKLMAAAGERRWCLVTWNKPNPTPLVNGNYLPDTEYILHAFQSGRLFGEYRDRARYIVHPVEQNEWDHPTVKPMAVVSKMVRLGSQERETICDPFAGTGTTLVAAKLLNRRATGIEINERYCEIAARRLSQGVLAL